MQNSIKARFIVGDLLAFCRDLFSYPHAFDPGAKLASA
jgi:hypothetical protein